MPIVIKASKNDRNDDLIRAFKKRVLQENVLSEVKRREFYKKPSQVKKEQRKELEHRRKVMLRLARKRKQR